MNAINRDTPWRRYRTVDIGGRGELLAVVGDCEVSRRGIFIPPPLKHIAEEFSVDEVLSRIWQSLDARVNGPLMFRLIMQPLIAAALAVREGLADADAGKPAYFWAILTRPAERRQLLREGWTAVVKVFVLAAILETVYELIVYGRIYPFEALLVSFVLACVPYILIRGPVNRIAASAHRTRSSC